MNGTSISDIIKLDKDVAKIAIDHSFAMHLDSLLIEVLRGWVQI